MLTCFFITIQEVREIPVENKVQTLIKSRDAIASKAAKEEYVTNPLVFAAPTLRGQSAKVKCIHWIH